MLIFWTFPESWSSKALVWVLFLWCYDVGKSLNIDKGKWESQVSQTHGLDNVAENI